MIRFTIRDLVLLTVIVALGVGWGLDRSQLAQELDSIYRNPFKPSPPTWWFGNSNGPQVASPDVS